jgi:hypothetical protein
MLIVRCNLCLLNVYIKESLFVVLIDCWLIVEKEGLVIGIILIISLGTYYIYLTLTVYLYALVHLEWMIDYHQEGKRIISIQL